MNSRAFAFADLSDGARPSLTVSALCAPFDAARRAPEPAPDPFACGVAAGKAQAAQDLAQAIAAFRTATSTLVAEKDRLEDLCRQDALLFLARLINAAAPKIALASALTELRAVIDSEAPPAPLEKIEIRANAAFLTELRSRLGEDDIGCAFIEDAALADGDLRATWPKGALDCGAATAIDAVKQSLDRRIAGLDQQEKLK